ncbi:MAG TPA: hypothetical protein VHC69_29460 [Polyangiaceae bacterium]|nr:hypothetical protein [Polyangiaceae bacterium]
MSVTVSEILIAARGALAAVSSETAGYLVLGAADCLGEGKLGVADVYLDEGGALHVDRRGVPAGTDAEPGLRILLKRLLETGRSPAPALLRVATTEERRGVPRLITEIEAALIPVNRAAARRALARLHRDVTRARSTPAFQTLAAELVQPDPSKVPPPVVARTAPPPVVTRTAPPPVVARTAPPPLHTRREEKDRSTEGPAPLIPVVEEGAPVLQVVEPVERPLAVAPLAIEPEATPFLGTVAATAAVVGSIEQPPHASEPEHAERIEELEEDELDTDPAPAVEFAAASPGETPAGCGTTVVIGTYAADVVPSAPAQAEAAPERQEDIHELEASEPPDAALYVAIPVVAVREPSPREDEDVSEERDGLDLALFDGPGEASEIPGDTFTSMFEFAPDGTAEPPEAAGDASFDALPPLVFAVADRTGIEPTKDADAIAEELGPDVPATPFAAPSEDAANESSFGHLAEALIEEALAVEPRPRVPEGPRHVPLLASSVPHTETVPGLGFVSVDVGPEAAPLDALADADEPRDVFWDEEPFSDFEEPTPSHVEVGASVASTYCPRRSDVAELVAAFVVAETRSLSELTRELKRIAGVSATPAPPEAVPAPRRKTSSAR